MSWKPGTVLMLLPLLVLALSSRPVLDAQLDPPRCGGLAFDRVDNRALLWTPSKTYLHISNVLDAFQLFDDANPPNPIREVQGIAYDPDTGRALLWTRSRVYLQQAFSTTVQEVGVNIAGVRGIVYDPGGGTALIWTADRLYQQRGIATVAQEVRLTGALGPVSDVQGVVFNNDDNLNITQALIWTTTAMYIQVNHSLRITELMFNQNSVPDILGVVCDPDSRRAHAILWNVDRVFFFANTALTEVTFNRNSIPAVRGAVFDVEHSQLQLTPALFWNGNHLYQLGNMEVSEVRAGGNPISGVRGVVYNPFNASNFSSALLWNAGHVYLQANYATTVTEVVVSGGAPGLIPIPDVQGIVYDPGCDFNTSSALIWNPGHVYLHANGARTASEVKDNGNPAQAISGVRGIAYAPYEGPATTHALIWNPAQVYIYANGRLVADELQDGQASIPDVQGVVYDPLGTRAYVWCPERVYLYANAAVHQVLDRTTRRSIHTYHPQLYYQVQVGVHHAGERKKHSFSGAGITGNPPPTPVRFTGSASGAVTVFTGHLPTLINFSTVLGAARRLDTALLHAPGPDAGIVSGSGMRVLAYPKPVPVRFHDPRFIGGGYGYRCSSSIAAGLFLLEADGSSSTLLVPGYHSYGWCMDADNRKIVFTVGATGSSSTCYAGPRAGIYRIDPATLVLETLAGPDTMTFYGPRKIHLNQDGDFVFGNRSRTWTGSKYRYDYNILKLDRSTRRLTTVLTTVRLGRPGSFRNEMQRNIDTGLCLVNDAVYTTTPVTRKYPVLEVDDTATLSPFSYWNTGSEYGWSGSCSMQQDHATGNLIGPYNRSIYQLQPGNAGRTTVATINILGTASSGHYNYKLDLQTAPRKRWVGTPYSSSEGYEQWIGYIDHDGTGTLTSLRVTGFEAGKHAASYDFEFYRGRHLQTVEVGPRVWDIRMSCPRFSEKAYVLLAGFSGVRPGIPLSDGRNINLNYDMFVQLTMMNMIPSIFNPGPGRLDASGEARGRLDLRTIPALGVPLWIAMLVLDAPAPGGIAYLPDTYVFRM